MRKHRARGPSQRQLRVAEEVRHALSRILERGKIRDPDLRDVSITVTEVRMSPDLKNATAFVMPLGGTNVEAVVAALQHAARFLRGQIAREVRLKNVPGLRFERDTAFERAGRIEELLHRPEVARDLRSAPVDSPVDEADGS